MNPQEIHDLESAIEAGIARALARHPDKQTATASKRTRHLMAKAAVSVLEAVRESQRGKRGTR